MINVEPLRNLKETKEYYPENSLIDMKLISPSSIRDLVDMYRIRWQHTQQTGIRDADKWRHLVENSHNNVSFHIGNKLVKIGLSTICLITRDLKKEISDDMISFCSQ